MKKMFVTPSKETDKLHMIQQLNLYGVYKTTTGSDLAKVDRYTLRSMLAVERATRA